MFVFVSPNSVVPFFVVCVIVSCHVVVYFVTSGYFVISSLLIMAISFALKRWLSVSSPQAFSKWAVFIPRDFAFWFINSTKASSLPPINSAIATAASLADAIAIDFVRTSTVCTSFGSRKIWEPPILAACSDIVTLSVHLIFPLCTASYIKSNVITFVTLAGGSAVSEFCCDNILPVDASISREAFASISGAVAEKAVELSVSTSNRVVAIIFFNNIKTSF